MSDTKTITLSARSPAKLVRLLDRAATESKRTRSAELLYRLEQSFRTQTTEVPGQGRR